MLATSLQLFVWLVGDDKVDGAFEEVKGHAGDLVGMPVAVPQGQPAGHHVRVVDGLHLVDVVALDPGVKQLVQRIQKLDYLLNNNNKKLVLLPTYGKQSLHSTRL